MEEQPSPIPNPSVESDRLRQIAADVSTSFSRRHGWHRAGVAGPQAIDEFDLPCAGTADKLAKALRTLQTATATLALSLSSQPALVLAVTRRLALGAASEYEAAVANQPWCPVRQRCRLP
jgi:hypothetical protein